MRIYLLMVLLFGFGACNTPHDDKKKQGGGQEGSQQEEQEEEAEQEEESEEEEEQQAEQQEEEEEASTAQLILDPEFSLNFQPSPNTPLFLPLVVTDIKSPVVELQVVAKDQEGKELNEIFMTESREVTKKENGLFDVAIAMPFLVNDKTMKGFEVDVTVKNVKDDKGNNLNKKSKFILSESVYSLWHRDNSSPLRGFAVVNEYLEPGFSGDLLQYIKMVKNSGGRSVGGAADADMEKIRETVEVSRDEDGEYISLKGATFFSFSFPGKARIKTNGHEIGVAGSDWSQVSIEVGYNAETRRKGSLATPEIFVAVFSPPRLVNQENKDEPMPYPQARGSRGMAASEGMECDRMLLEVARGIPNFRSSRATCRNEFRALSGQDRTLLLIKKNDKARVPVVSEDPRDFGSLVDLEQGGRSIFQVSRDGERCSGGNCLMVEHDPDSFQRSPNGYEPTENLLQDLESLYDPNQKDIYPGKDKIMVMPVGENLALSSGESRFDKDNSVIYGAADLWENPETIAWADGICAREMEQNIKAWAAPYGTIEDLSDLQEEGKTALFSNMIPGVHAISNVDASADGDSSSITVVPETKDHLERSSSLYRASMSGVDYRLNGEAEQSLKALSPTIEVMGGPGGNGASSPFAVVHLPVEAGEYLYQDIENLRGASGPYGYSIRKELTNGLFRIEVLSPGGDYHGYKVDCSSDDLKEGCVLKQAEDGSYVVDYFSTDADLKAGHKIRLSYETKRVQGTYQASYEDYKTLKARFKVNQTFDMMMGSSSNGFLAAGNGFAGGGLRAGSNKHVLSRNYGFWNFNMAKEPVYFHAGWNPRKTWKKVVNGGKEFGKSMSNSFKKVFVCPATGMHCWDSDTQVDLCSYDFKGADEATVGATTLRKPRQMQSLRFREAPGEVNCRDYVKLGPGVSVNGDWKVNTTVHYFADDANFPECMGGNHDYDKCSHRQRKSPEEERNLNNDIESYENNCVSRFLYKPYSDYKSSIEAACRGHFAYKQAKKAQDQNDALQKFLDECEGECKAAAMSMKWLIENYPIESLEEIVKGLKDSRNLKEGEGQTYLNEAISYSKYELVSRKYMKFKDHKDLINRAYKKHQPVWSHAMKQLTDSDFYFDSQALLDAAVPKYNALLKDLSEVHRPKITSLSCRYEIKGIFRKFKPASLESVSLIADKYFVTETRLKRDYHYQANKVRRKVIMPNVASINPQNVILRQENSAKEGRLQLPARTVISDCADLANRLISIGAPLPKNMFLNACS